MNIKKYIQMKNKTILLIIASLLFGFTAFSQSEGISFGIRAGGDFQTFNGKDMNNDKLELKMVPRFNAGVIVNIPFAPEFCIQSGLLFSTKGAKSADKFLGIDMSAEYNISYIELPINLLYKAQLGSGNIMLGFGPYLAYGVTGKAKYTISSVSSEDKIVFAKEYSSLNPSTWNTFNPFDYGGNILFGYELNNGISFQLNTQLGLAKINAENTTFTNEKTTFRNTGFGLSVGYMF